MIEEFLLCLRQRKWPRSSYSFDLSVNSVSRMSCHVLVFPKML